VQSLDSLAQDESTEEAVASKRNNGWQVVEPKIGNNRRKKTQVQKFAEFDAPGRSNQQGNEKYRYFKAMARNLRAMAYDKRMASSDRERYRQKADVCDRLASEVDQSTHILRNNAATSQKDVYENIQQARSFQRCA